MLVGYIHVWIAHLSLRVYDLIFPDKWVIRVLSQLLRSLNLIPQNAAFVDDFVDTECLFSFQNYLLSRETSVNG